MEPHPEHSFPSVGAKLNARSFDDLVNQLYTNPPTPEDLLPGITAADRERILELAANSRRQHLINKLYSSVEKRRQSEKTIKAVLEYFLTDLRCSDDVKRAKALKTACAKLTNHAPKKRKITESRSAEPTPAPADPAVQLPPPTEPVAEPTSNHTTAEPDSSLPSTTQ
jgi:DNA topoisomerase VI subunit B